MNYVQVTSQSDYILPRVAEGKTFSIIGYSYSS